MCHLEGRAVAGRPPLRDGRPSRGRRAGPEVHLSALCWCPLVPRKWCGECSRSRRWSGRRRLPRVVRAVVTAARRPVCGMARAALRCPGSWAPPTRTSPRSPNASEVDVDAAPDVAARLVAW